jgi:hypothetical protein
MIISFTGFLEYTLLFFRLVIGNDTVVLISKVFITTHSILLGRISGILIVAHAGNILHGNFRILLSRENFAYRVIRSFELREA